jgi:parvulin-like peptidyl-prolyl isomerase
MKTIPALVVHFIAATLAAAQSSGVDASTTTPVASRGTAEATAQDIDSLHFMMADDRRAALKRDDTEVLKSLDEVLNTRHFARDMKKDFKMSVAEKAYSDMQIERASLSAALAIEERRARAKFDPNATLSEQRAREIWIKDERNFYNDQQADITVIQFDLSKRSWSETIARVAEVQAEIKKETSFDSLVMKYSDDTGKDRSNGRVFSVAQATSDPPLARVIFDRLKVGDVSEPVAARRGLYIVRLDAKRDRTKKPFDEVKAQILADLIEVDARNARKALLQKIESVPVTTNQAALDAILSKPDPNAAQKLRDIHRQAIEGTLPAPNTPTSTGPGSQPK